VADGDGGGEGGGLTCAGAAALVAGASSCAPKLTAKVSAPAAIDNPIPLQDKCIMVTDTHPRSAPYERRLGNAATYGCDHADALTAGGSRNPAPPGKTRRAQQRPGERPLRAGRQCGAGDVARSSPATTPPFTVIVQANNAVIAPHQLRSGCSRPAAWAAGHSSDAALATSRLARG